MESCEAFRDIDDLFINYEANDEKFNTGYGSYNNYCPVKNGARKCETDSEKLSAISGHAYVELTKNEDVNLDSEYDPSVDFLVMALSHRLYKLSKDHTLSIKDAFTKYLGKYMGSFNHMSILYNKKYFMGYNIGVMNGFYLLFKQICETIRISENPNAQQYEYLNSVTQCYIMYNTLYNFVKKCGPYLQLLHHLKTIYDEFKKAIIKGNSNSEFLRDNLIELSPIDPTKFGYEFESSGCKRVNKNLIEKTPNIIKIGIKMLKDDEKRKNGEISQSTEDEDDEEDDLDLDDEEDDLYEEEDDLYEEEDDDDLQNNPQGTPPVPAPGIQQQPPAQSTSGQHPSTQPISTTPSTDIQNGVVNNPNDPNGDPNSQPTNQGDKQVNQNGDSANPDTSQRDSGGGSSGSGSGGKDSGGRDPGSGANDGSSGGSKSPGDPAATDSSGGSNGYWLSNWGSRFNPINYLPSASEIYETQKSILTSASNKISNAYNSAVTTIKDTYNSAVITVKDTYNSAVTNINYAYTTSTNYISGAVSSITNQLSSLGSFSQLGNDQSELGGPGNSLPTDNKLPSATQTPKSDLNPVPRSPSPSPSPPQSLPPLVTPPDPQTSSSSQPQDPPQNIQVTKLQPQSGSTQDSSQITDQNGESNPLQSHDTNPGTGISQTTNYSTDPPSTGSRITTGTVVKMNEKSSIWCIGSNKKCDILGIGIIGISIFVFLVIMYKYISFGSAKNSKKKKSMKRVIKYGDRTRKTQIIIKSYDRNNDLKPIINSVGRKKDTTLNIYKLMQADPVPFINLFFLLIFFVYKNKLNYLEL
ncbi:PIR protein CIR protein [Plasmodium vinckei]|uniref:PIR protein CIR protein n=1 Tax=Plasmodium vinckei TaxID=5860 RepID=A0A6V7T7H9_PLAVN|nr:PIR protein CIR protein [Plasmodium vinckei]